MNIFVYLSLVREPQPVKKVVRVTPKGKALFDFDGEFEDELSFKVNMRISCCFVVAFQGVKTIDLDRFSRRLETYPGYRKLWLQPSVLLRELPYYRKLTLVLIKVFEINAT